MRKKGKGRKGQSKLKAQGKKLKDIFSKGEMGKGERGKVSLKRKAQSLKKLFYGERRY